MAVAFFLIFPGINKVCAEEPYEPQRRFVFLTDIHGMGFWAWYNTDEDNFGWNGQVELKSDVLRFKKCTFYFLANIETVIERESNPFIFNPNSIIYTLEPGLILKREGLNLSFFIHHICRHDVDRNDELHEKWEIYGIRGESKNTEETFNSSTDSMKYLGNFHKMVSLGKYTRQQDNRYDWDARLEGKLDILKYKESIFYFYTGVHTVTQRDERPSGEFHFTDFLIEPGFRFPGERGNISIFVQYQYKHDIDRYNGQTLDCGLLGIRYEW